ncbi:hypothetical protein HX747_30800 [Streptomyces sp. L06]|nr:hypothetical protein [Streptomyces sp. L06]
MVRTIALLNRVLELNEAGRIPVEPEVFDERVALEDTTFRYQGQLYEAAVGTPAPTSVTEPWGETWAPSARREAEIPPIQGMSRYGCPCGNHLLLLRELSAPRALGAGETTRSR